MTKRKMKSSRSETSTSNKRRRPAKSTRIVVDEEEEVQTPIADVPKRKSKNSRSEASTSNTRRRPAKSRRNVVDEEEQVLTPFADVPIKWAYKRYHLIEHPHKTMLTGYESMAGNIKAVLKTLTKRTRREVYRSCFKYYTQLDDTNTRSGNMLHYIVFREIVPTPNPDTTALWFKVGDNIIRFSREEYALVSGLRFGQSNFNPYKAHKVPADSVFARLFNSNRKITTSHVSEMFINKHFSYWEGDEPDSVEKTVIPTEDDYVKLAKLLIALTYVLGYEQTRKPIPIWIWVLLEDKDAWEQFPWGSLSYQLLTHSITNLKKNRVPKSGTISYHILGNTIAFSAWIFEAVPTLGSEIGSKKEDVIHMPRMLQYKYSISKKFPKANDIKKDIHQMLTPTDEETQSDYWQSLSYDPVKMPFAFKYEPNHEKKRKRSDRVDAETSSPLCIDKRVLKKLGKYAGKAAAKKMKLYMDEMKESMMQEILKHLSGVPCTNEPNHDDTEHFVFNDFMQSPQHSEHHEEPPNVNAETGDVTAERESEQMAEGEAATELDAANKLAADEAANKETTHAAKSTLESTEGEDAEKENNTEDAEKKNNSEDAEKEDNSEDAEKENNTEDAEKKNNSEDEEKEDNSEDAENEKNGDDAEENNGDDSHKENNGHDAEKEGNGDDAEKENNGHDAEKEHNSDDAAKNNTEDELGTQDTAEILTEKVDTVEDDSITDTQMNDAFDEVMTSISGTTREIVVSPILASDIALQILEPGETRPKRLRYPSRACKSPYKIDDTRAGINTFDDFLKSKKEIYRNVGLLFGVDRDFFKKILKPDQLLEEDAVNSYLSILSAKPEFAGIAATKETITIEPSYFISHIEDVFDAIHKKKKKNSLDLYQTKDFKPNVEEKMTARQMEKLLKYAAGEYPAWSDNMKPWIECEKIVTMCLYADHWATVVIDLKKQKICLYDSKSWEFTEDDRKKRMQLFLPMARVLPQVMKYIGYYEVHNIRNPQYTQWEICFAPTTGKYTYKQKDMTSCGLYSLQALERIVASVPASKGLKTMDEICTYRTHIARTIYGFSTDEEPGPFPILKL